MDGSPMRSGHSARRHDIHVGEFGAIDWTTDGKQPNDHLVHPFKAYENLFAISVVRAVYRLPT